MFVQNLNRKQQSVLLHLAREVMEADERLHENERGILEVLASQVEESVLPQSISFEEDLSLFDTNISKVSLLLELIGVAYADGDYHKNENALINRYASAIGISEEKLLKLESWVSKQLNLTLEVQELLA